MKMLNSMTAIVAENSATYQGKAEKVHVCWSSRRCCSLEAVIGGTVRGRRETRAQCEFGLACWLSSQIKAQRNPFD